jgi:hypothetical protein
MARNTAVVVIYHHHKLLDLIYVNNEHTGTTETQNTILIKKLITMKEILNSFPVLCTFSNMSLTEEEENILRTWTGVCKWDLHLMFPSFSVQFQ